ncbi:glycine cleavage system protein T [Catellatospora sp. TT07R-123]|nr:folate-binding protein YgfZ [Catellatospora sp. TT07R-123]GHJ46313.1 glycine cleavage system protein T [Catellatospora sp. TT07R-123]
MGTPTTVGQLDPTSPDAPVAAHLGDPMREQRTLLTGAAVVDRSHRGVLALTGPERLSFLHNLTSQHLTALADGQGTRTLVLSPHGHVEHELWLAELDGTLWVDVEPGTVDDLVGFLTKMRFFTQVEIKPADLALYSVVGPGALSAVVRLGVAVPAEPDVLPVPEAKFHTGSVPPRPTSVYGLRPLPSATGGTGGFLRRHALGDLPVVDLLLPRATAEQTLAELDLPRAGLWAYEAVRAAAKQARVGTDTDHRTLPSEVDLTAVAVHLEKGCYRGQETVARVHHLGRPPRALRLLHLDGIGTDELPAKGTEVTADGRTVGFVGTTARHAELGPIALAVLKRNISGETPLSAGESTAAIDPD